MSQVLSQTIEATIDTTSDVKDNTKNVEERDVVDAVSVVCDAKQNFSALKKRIKALHFGFETVFMGKSIGFQCFGKFTDYDNEKVLDGY